MDEYNESIMVAMLPTTNDWCKIELPHTTLVYAGEIKDSSVTEFNKMAKEVSDLAVLSRPLAIDTFGIEVFGNEEKVDVIRLLATPELMAIRNTLVKYDVSEHPFHPHVTVGPVGSANYPIPTRLFFDRFLIKYGQESMVFKLR